MPTTLFDPSELLRKALKAWWTTNSATLSALGDVVVGNDDGTPLTGERSDLPNVSLRFGLAQVGAITNTSRHYVVTVVFQVYGKDRKAAVDAIAPLDRLLCNMADDYADILTLDEGYVSGVKVNRFTCTQISKLRWRAEREVEFAVQLDRKSA